MDAGKQYAYGSFDHVVQTGHLVMPDWAGQLTVLHELAHVCVEAEHGWLNVASHGEQWASVYLRLVERHLGPKIAEALRTCFAACRVSH
jgi:putative metallohydrolase (TIGR04338 family)